MNEGPSLFSEDYQQARERFCTTATSSGWTLESYPRDGGRERELFTDIARIGSQEPKRLFVISSALHGVEGFLGSAIQLRILEKIDVNVFQDSNSSILLVHALNPFGYARIRRFDEKNVDVNRNFLLPGEEYHGAHGYYSKFDSLLNPKKWPRWEIPPHLQALLKVIPYGFENLQQAIAQGQYDYPLGLFFGGNEPSTTVHFVRSRLLSELKAANEVIHLDIHTGLGQRGKQALLFDYQLDAPEEQKLLEITDNVLKLENVETHYQALGSFYSWLRHNIPNVFSFCWEFGTYPPVSVLAALREENAACHWGDRGSKAFEKAKAKLKEAFCPKSQKWRSQVIEKADRVIDAVLANWLIQ